MANQSGKLIRRNGKQVRQISGPTSGNNATSKVKKTKLPERYVTKAEPGILHSYVRGAKNVIRSAGMSISNSARTYMQNVSFAGSVVKNNFGRGMNSVKYHVPRAIRYNKDGLVNRGRDAMIGIRMMKQSSRGLMNKFGTTMSNMAQSKFVTDMPRSFGRFVKSGARGKSGLLGGMLAVTAGLVGALSSSRHGRGEY